MKRLSLVLLFSLYSVLAFSQVNSENNNIDNLKTFAKLYGFARWFNPASETKDINFDDFAIYGCSKVQLAKNETELVQTLNELFLPIMPGLQLGFKDKLPEYPKNILKPPFIKDYNLCYWQHLGVENMEFDQSESLYRSIRINDNNTIYTWPKNSQFRYISLCRKHNIENYAGQEFRISAYVRMAEQGNSKGYLWARIDKNKKGDDVFFENMYNNPIIDTSWVKYTITGTVPSNGKILNLGAYTSTNGPMYVDLFLIEFKKKGGKFEPFWFDDFEYNYNQDFPEYWTKGIGIKNKGTDGSICFSKEYPNSGNQCIQIKLEKEQREVNYVVGKKLFKAMPAPNEILEMDLGLNLTCRWPLSLYIKDFKTYPISDSTNVSELKNILKNFPLQKKNDLDTRLAATIIFWNMMQHFYPYFKETGTNWDEAFNEALKDCFQDSTETDFNYTLQKFSAKLKDGHVKIFQNKHNPLGQYLPNFTWEWIGDHLYISQTGNSINNLKPGDEILEINHKPVKDYFEERSKFISSAKNGFMHQYPNSRIIENPDSTYLTLLKSDINGKIDTIATPRNIIRETYFKRFYNQISSKELEPSIYYINLDIATIYEIDSLLPKLTKAKGIIFDLRGYPNDNHNIIRYLLQNKDTCKSWLQVPQYIYPNNQLSGYADYGWQLKPAKPHLSAKIVFLIDGRAQSYAESLLGFIEGYKLATIMGQPTAGTNGDINYAYLPGNYQISFTGMHVRKLNGSQLHGIGIQPDILLFKTRQGLSEGKDEFLEKALQEIKK